MNILETYLNNLQEGKAEKALVIGSAAYIAFLSRRIYIAKQCVKKCANAKKSNGKSDENSCFTKCVKRW